MLVKRKIQKGLGWARQNCHYRCSSNPLELQLWFRKIGVKLVEGYSMTENLAVPHQGWIMGKPVPWNLAPARMRSEIG